MGNAGEDMPTKPLKTQPPQNQDHIADNLTLWCQV